MCAWNRCGGWTVDYDRPNSVGWDAFVRALGATTSGNSTSVDVEDEISVLLSSFMRMPHGSEPQSIRTRSEESEEGGVPPDVKVDASSKSQLRTQTMKTG